MVGPAQNQALTIEPEELLGLGLGELSHRHQHRPLTFNDLSRQRIQLDRSLNGRR